MTDIEITGLYEKTGASEEAVKALRAIMFENTMHLRYIQSVIVSKGGNIHGVDKKATAKRRAQNRAARKARRLAKR